MASSSRKRPRSASASASGRSASEQPEQRRRTSRGNGASSSTRKTTKSKTYAEPQQRTYTTGESDNASSNSDIDEKSDAESEDRSDENEHDRRARKRREAKVNSHNGTDDEMSRLRNKFQRKRGQPAASSKKPAPADEGQDSDDDFVVATSSKKPSRKSTSGAASRKSQPVTEQTRTTPEFSRKVIKSTTRTVLPIFNAKDGKNRRALSSSEEEKESDNGDVQVPQLADVDADEARAMVENGRDRALSGETITVQGVRPYALKDGATLGKDGPLIVNGKPQKQLEPKKRVSSSKRKAIEAKDPDIPVPALEDYERSQKILSEDPGSDQENAEPEDDDNRHIRNLLASGSRNRYDDLARGARDLASESEAEMEVEEAPRPRREKRPSNAESRPAPKGVRKSTAIREEPVSKKRGSSKPTVPRRRISNSPPKRSTHDVAEPEEEDSSDDSEGIVVANSSAVVTGPRPKKSSKAVASSGEMERQTSKQLREAERASKTSRKEEKRPSKRHRTEEEDVEVEVRPKGSRKSTHTAGHESSSKGKAKRRQSTPPAEEEDQVIAIPLSDDDELLAGDSELELPPPLSHSKRKRSPDVGSSSRSRRKTVEGAPVRSRKSSDRAPVRLVDVSDREASPAFEAREESHEAYDRLESTGPQERGRGPDFGDMDMDHPGTGAVLEVRDEQDPEPAPEEVQGVLQSGLSESDLRKTRREQDEEHLSVSHEQAIERKKLNKKRKAEERREDSVEENQTEVTMRESAEAEPDRDLPTASISRKSQRSASSRKRSASRLSTEPSKPASSGKDGSRRSRSTRSASVRTASPPKPTRAAEESRKKPRKSKSSSGAPTKPRKSTAVLYTDDSSDEETVAMQKSAPVKRTVAVQPEREPSPAQPPAEDEAEMEVDAPASEEEPVAVPKASASSAARKSQRPATVDVASSPELPEVLPAQSPRTARRSSVPPVADGPAREPEVSEDEDEDAALEEIAAALAARGPRRAGQPFARVEVSTTFTVSYDVEVAEMWSDEEDADDLLEGIREMFEGYVEEPTERARLARVKSPAPRPSRKGKERAVEPEDAEDAMQVDEQAALAPDQAEAGPSKLSESPRRSPRRAARDITPAALGAALHATPSPRKKAENASNLRSPARATRSNAPTGDATALAAAIEMVEPEAAVPAENGIASGAPGTEPSTSDEEVARQVTVVPSRKSKDTTTMRDTSSGPSSPRKDKGKGRAVESQTLHRKRMSSAHIVVEIPHSPYHSQKPVTKPSVASSSLLERLRAAEKELAAAIEAELAAERAAAATDASLQEAAPIEEPVLTEASSSAAAALVDEIATSIFSNAEPEESADPSVNQEAVIGDVETVGTIDGDADMEDAGPETSAAAAAREAETEAVAEAIIEDAVEETLAEQAMEADVDAAVAVEPTTTMEIDEVTREETTLSVQAGSPPAAEVEIAVEEESEVHVTVESTPGQVDTAPEAEAPAPTATDELADTIAEASTVAEKAAPETEDNSAEVAADEIAAAIAEADVDGDKDAEGEADMDGAVENIIDAATQVHDQAEADADAEGEDEAPEVESSLPGPARDNVDGGVEDVTVQSTFTAAASAEDAVVESSEEDSLDSSDSSEEEAGDASASGSNMDADADMEEDEPVFSIGKLIAWADDLKDENDPQVINREGAEKLFSQMDLDMEGPHSLLLAWKMEASTTTPIQKADFVAVLSENEIDTPRKLAEYLNNLAATTLTMNKHKRFDDDGNPVESLKAPDAYRGFYEWSYGYTVGADNELALDVAIQLWSIVLEPSIDIGKDLLAFLRNNADRLELEKSVDRDAWNKTLDFCLSVKLPQEGQEGAGLVGYGDDASDKWPALLQEYADWVSKGRLEE